MEAEIRNNLVYLTNHLTSLPEVMDYLIQHDIISTNEKEIIDTERTSQEKNSKLLSTLKTKEWNRVGNLFLKILLLTNNEHCAEKIQGIPTSSQKWNRLLHPKMKSKWWPNIKPLITSLHKRKIGSRLLVEELHKRILADENRMVVLCESADAAKYSGMGGIGKTLTAKWYANHYEKEYDHILWFDCGEGSLLHSFKKLAMELEVKNWDKYIEVEDYSRLSFQELSEFKCLWIYDNAASYKEKEGIINVLPIKQNNFFCLITSRSREWGVEDVGYGKISELELDIFNEQESLDFLKNKLRKDINCSDLELRELSRLLGNLPMSMELALATLNGKKMEIQKYLKKLREKDLKILGVKFDKYEETINKNIKISIEEIQEEEAGDLAIKILNVFGYIRPDGISQEFIQKIFNSQVDESIDLLVKYSLISKEKNFFYSSLSIHRLLQQVLRHNGKNKETEILKKILGCEGFIDYKLIPFTKYANKKLQKEFPKVKAELLDQKKLHNLMIEKRLDECVQLARFIDEEMKTNTTKFNFAICLHKDGQSEESIKTLKELDGQLRDEINYKREDVEMGLLKLEAEVSRELFGGHLLLPYCKMNKEKAKEILENKKRFLFLFSQENLDILIRLLQEYFRHSNYSLKKDWDSSLIELTLDVQTKTIALMDCWLRLDSFDLLSLEHLRLYKVQVLNWTKCNWIVNQLYLREISLVEKTNMKVQEMTIVDSSLDISCLPETIHKITLDRMSDVFTSRGVQLPHLKQLTLINMMDVSCLCHFHTAPLNGIELIHIRGVNMDLLPPNLTTLKINNHVSYNDRIVSDGGVRSVDNLNLAGFSFKQVEECLSHFQTHNLIIEYYPALIGVEELTLLMKKPIKTIALGPITWGEGLFEKYSSHLDRQGDYYLLQGGKGRAIEWQEFNKLRLFL